MMASNAEETAMPTSKLNASAPTPQVAAVVDAVVEIVDLVVESASREGMRSSSCCGRGRVEPQASCSQRAFQNGDHDEKKIDD